MRSLARLAALGATVVPMLAVMAGPASADTLYVSKDITIESPNWTTGTHQYPQTHNGDDIGFDLSSGIRIDARWRTCDGSSTDASIDYNLTTTEGRRTIGYGFYAGTCLLLQYRPAEGSGTDVFAGYVHWDYSWV
jgi:hypothetical protein